MSVVIFLYVMLIYTSAKFFEIKISKMYWKMTKYHFKNPQVSSVRPKVNFWPKPKPINRLSPQPSAEAEGLKIQFKIG